MSGEQQLERSVLEHKERDELHAIAEALGLKPPSRTKKADLVDQILRATGVETPAAEANGDAGGEAPKPKRTRTPRAKAAVEAPPAADTEAAGDAAVDGGNGNDTGNGSGAAPAERESATTGEDEAADPPAPAGDAGAATQPPAEAAESDRAVVQSSNGDGGEATGAEATGAAAEQARDGGGPGPRDRAPARFDGPAEAGNRRNRRRRGRDRDRPERGELQGGPAEPFSGEPVPVSGLLDLRDEGFGFLRAGGYLASPKDVYVSISQVRRFALRKGDHLEGASRPAGTNEKYPALLRIDTVNGLSPVEATQRPRFEDLTPLFPDSRLRLEDAGEPYNMTARIIDLISPIGKGQRGLIVSPPKAGKTTIMKQIAKSIEKNNPEVHLMVLLVDERPEEVTDMRRSVQGEVIGSTFDRPADEHTQVAELTVERGKRLAEMGKDVVIILDGITRLARAYNLAAPASGRILSGGIDTGALYPPKKFFGAARNLEEGGSLTILATALVETGSKMDEVIFEEFKGTGNMELRLDRRLAERRIYPAIDVNASSTRHEELLFDRKQLEMVWRLRRVLNGLQEDGSGAKAIELLFDRIKATRSNEEFLADVAKAAQPG